MPELFDRVDALIACRAVLPPPAERKRLRQAHGFTLDEVAEALQVRRATVSAWESGKTEPRPPERDAYPRLLSKLVELFPADPSATAPVHDTAAPATFASTPAPAPEARTLSTAPASEAATMAASENTEPRPTATTAAPAAASRPARTTRPSSTSRRPAARKAAPENTPANADPRFADGPLAVVDVDDAATCWRIASVAWSWTCPPSPSRPWSTGP